MTPNVPLLLVAVISGVAGALIAMPAWRSYRARLARHENAERYLAWRGRADRPSSAPQAGMSATERRRIWIGAGLGIVAGACLVVGLSAG